MTPNERLKEIELRVYPRWDVALDYTDSDWLITRVKQLTEALDWIMPKVHQGYHEGDIRDCQKATCAEYRKVLKE